MSDSQASTILDKVAELSPVAEAKYSLSEIIELLENNHDIQSQFGGWKPNSGGLLGSLKNVIQTKLANIVVAVTRPAFRKQEKFNQLTLQALKLIAKQQDETRSSQSN